MKYTLILEDEFAKTKVTHEFNEEYLPSVLEHFEQFLRGCGFYFDGTLDIVKPEISESLSDDDYEIMLSVDESYEKNLDSQIEIPRQCSVCSLTNKQMFGYQCFETNPNCMKRLHKEKT